MPQRRQVVTAPCTVPARQSSEELRRAKCQDVDTKNEARILTEPARAAQFGKSRGGWQNASRLHFLTFVCSGPMSIKALSKIFVVVAITVFAGWRAIGHPAYLDLYVNDPRSKPEL